MTYPNPYTPAPAFRDVAVIDDDEEQANVMSELVRHAGLNPIRIEGRYRNVRTLILAVKQNAQAAVCDHRLRYGAFGDFTGAEAAAKLIEIGVPTVLVTQFVEQDDNVSIREWRHKLPVVLSRREADSRRVLEALIECKSEMSGTHAPDRRRHRTILQIVDTDKQAGERVFDVIIPAWDPDTAVRLPSKLIPARLRRHAKPGTCLIAEVNIEARHSVDLFFERFESAPEPDAHDELA